jgi:nitroreductase
MLLKSIELPKPNAQGSISLEQAIEKRKSVRSFTKQALSLDLIGQILWAGQGLRGSASSRTVPSAGALYPLELYLVTEEGVYHYFPDGHRMEPHVEGDMRSSLTAVFSRIESKYGKERSPQYIYLEAGHAAQNILLQATALGLNGVPVGAFYEEQVSKVLQLPQAHYPLYLIPLGFAERIG